MFLFAFWVISTQKCVVVNFHKFKSAGIPIRPFKYLGMPILIKAHVPCTCTCSMHAHHDVTRFVLENHQVWVVPPNGGHSLVSQDNECWEVNKG